MRKRNERTAMFVWEQEWPYVSAIHICKETAVMASDQVNLVHNVKDKLARILSTHFQIFVTNETKNN